MLWLAQPSVFVKPFPCFNLRIVATYPRSAHLPIWNHHPGASGIGYAHLRWRKQFLAILGYKSFRWAFFFHCRGFWDRRKESFASAINSATSSSALSSVSFVASLGWEWDSWDSGLWRKNQGFLLPSWVFYGKQVCSIYVDQQTLAFSRSFDFVSCCLWNSEEFSYLFLQDFGDFK